jgi:hypothetical protein
MWREITEVVRNTIFQEDEADEIDVFDLKVHSVYTAGCDIYIYPNNNTSKI